MIPILKNKRFSIAGLKPKVTKFTKRNPRRLKKKSLLIARLKQNRNAKVTKHGKRNLENKSLLIARKKGGDFNMNNINPFAVMKAEKRLRQQKGKQALLRRLQQIRKHKAYYDKELYHEKIDLCDADGVTAVNVSIRHTASV